MLALERIDLDDADWEALDSYADRSVFQTRPWLDFLVATQGGEPVLARVLDGSKTVGWFTGLIVRRFGVRILGSPMRGWSTGPMGFNLEPGTDRRAAAEALFRFAFSDLRCLHVELFDRGLDFEDAAALGAPYTDAVVFEMDLTRSESDLFDGMSRAARKAIRKAARDGITVESADPEGFAEEYYAQLEDVFAKQDLRPPYGIDRVHALIRHLAPTGKLKLQRARAPSGEPAATALRLECPAFAYSWGAASWREHQQHRPNEALFWFAMQEIQADGIPLLDLGGGGDYKRKYGVSEANRPFLRRSRFRGIETGRNVAAQLYWRAATRRPSARRSR